MAGGQEQSVEQAAKLVDGQHDQTGWGGSAVTFGGGGHGQEGMGEHGQALPATCSKTESHRIGGSADSGQTAARRYACRGRSIGARPRFRSDPHKRFGSSRGTYDRSC